MIFNFFPMSVFILHVLEYLFHLLKCYVSQMPFCESLNTWIIEQLGLFVLYVISPREWVVQTVSSRQQHTVFSSFYFHKYCPFPSTSPPPQEPLTELLQLCLWTAGPGCTGSAVHWDRFALGLLCTGGSCSRAQPGFVCLYQHSVLPFEKVLYFNSCRCCGPSVC